VQGLQGLENAVKYRMIHLGGLIPLASRQWFFFWNQRVSMRRKLFS